MAAREKHGIYVDEENYKWVQLKAIIFIFNNQFNSQMMETIEEKSSKVEELENRLLAMMQQVKIVSFKLKYQKWNNS